MDNTTISHVISIQNKWNDTINGISGHQTPLTICGMTFQEILWLKQCAEEAGITFPIKKEVLENKNEGEFIETNTGNTGSISGFTGI